MLRISLMIFFFLITILYSIAQTPVQNIRGIVIDRQTRATLPGANVVVKDLAYSRGVSTDINGNFLLSEMPVGRHTIAVSYMGYEIVEIRNILVTSGKEVFLEVEMQQSPVTLNEALVIGHEKSRSINELAMVSSRMFTVEEAERYAGSRADPARMASNFAGVVGGGDMRNDIIVRGNTPYGILWRLEGLEIPSPNHYSFVGTAGGLFSMLNTNVLANSDFLSGAFPAEYGGRYAAAFDLRMRNGNPAKREHMFQAGLNGLELGTEGGFRKNYTGSYLINYRMFTLKPLQMLGVDFRASGIPEFQDGAFKVHLPTARYGNFSLFGIMGSSTLSLLNSERKPDDWDAIYNDDITFGSSTGFLGFTHSRIFGDRLFARLSILLASTHVTSFREFDFDDSAPVLKEDLSMRESYVTFQYELNYRLAPKHFMKAGTSFRPVSYNLYQIELEDLESGIYHTHFDDDGQTGYSQSFISWNFRPTKSLTFVSGLHLQTLFLNNTYSLEPRLGLSYNTGAKSTLSLGYGLHGQVQPLIFYIRDYSLPSGENRQNNKNLQFSKSHHFVIGYDYRVNPVLRLKTEAYYQDLFNIPVSARYPHYSAITQGAEFSFWIPDSLMNTGTGKNYGLEITLERFFSNNYYYLFTASLFESRYTGGTGIKYHTPFGVGNVVNVLFGYELGLGEGNTHALIFDFKSTWAGGRRYIPIDIEQSVLLGREVRDISRAYQERFHDFLKTDVKISYRSNRPGSTHYLFLAADNLFNNRNPLMVNYDNTLQDVTSTYQLGFFPYLGYRVQF